jgi:hypothetical protein
MENDSCNEADRSKLMKILICGVDGSGKSLVSELLAKALNGVWLDGKIIREEYNDQDYTTDGKLRQAARMKSISNDLALASPFIIADFVGSTREIRDTFDPDFVVWMNTIHTTSEQFEPFHGHCDYDIIMTDSKSDIESTVKQISDLILSQYNV